MMTVRRAGLQDTAGAYRVCLLTGDSGQDATGLYENPDLLGHVYVGPYLAGAPDHALVVVDAHGVAGYCLVAPDTTAFEHWAEHHWWPPLREQYPATDEIGPDADLTRHLHAPGRAPDSIVTRYPAHLHIDLLDRVRGSGLGRVLIEGQLNLLRARGAAGLHLDVARDNPNARAFYRHLGFTDAMELDDSILMGLPLN